MVHFSYPNLSRTDIFGKDGVKYLIIIALLFVFCVWVIIIWYKYLRHKCKEKINGRSDSTSNPGHISQLQTNFTMPCQRPGLVSTRNYQTSLNTHGTVPTGSLHEHQPTNHYIDIGPPPPCPGL